MTRGGGSGEGTRWCSLGGGSSDGARRRGVDSGSSRPGYTSLSLSMLPSPITDPLHPSVLPTVVRVDLVTAALDLAMPRLTPTTTRSDEGGT
jgi:hypothetical protein